MIENRKHILDEFQKHLFQQYDSYCIRHDLTPSLEGMITFIIDQDIIPSSNIKKYAVRQEFNQLLTKQEIRKTKTVQMLSDKFNIPERTVWSLLKTQKT